ncbi:MAG: TrmH family RNA methyltransferase [Candidatus Dojkabacteria bacterium]|nr:MAG: TrmH family RNA methyltransferase [Candidatus Dojkabacteria bacterium]
MKQLRGIELKRFKRKLERPKLELVLVLENIQYARNVASMFRTADASGVKEIFLTGISHIPPFGKELQKVSRSKENSVRWQQGKTTGKVIEKLRRQGYAIIAVELTDDAISVKDFVSKYLPKFGKIALIVGNEAQGVSKATLAKADHAIYIPMFGKGASLNVTISCAIAIYTLIQE